MMSFLAYSGVTEGATRLTSDDAAANDWPYYHGNPSGTHYSQLKDIHTGNVGKLKLAWSYDTRDKLGINGTIESNPLIVARQLFFVSPMGRLICLDAATGAERRIFDPGARTPASIGQWQRGVSYWSDGKESRILFSFNGDL